MNLQSHIALALSRKQQEDGRKECKRQGVHDWTRLPGWDKPICRRCGKKEK
jgi:hypothetical protein